MIAQPQSRMRRVWALWMLVGILLLSSTAHCKLGQEPTDNVVAEWMRPIQKAVGVNNTLNLPAAKVYALYGLASMEALRAGGASPYALAGHTALTTLFPSVPLMKVTYPDLLNIQLTAIGRDNKPLSSPADREAAERVAVDIVQQVLRAKGASNGQVSTTAPLVLSAAEVDALALNTDPAKGFVYRAPRNDYAETFKYGAKNSSARTAQQTDLAAFWNYGPGTPAITGAWLDIAREVLPELSLQDTALFYARAAAASFDATIVANKIKAVDNHPRPQMVFRKGLNGWPADPGWESLLPTPPDAEYPSGHSVTSGAVLEVLLRTLNGADPAFTKDGCSFKSLTAAANGVGDSRVFGGVHFRSSTVDGVRLGRAVAAKVFERIQPVGAAAAAKQPAVAAEAGRPEGKKAAAGGRRLAMMSWV